MKTMLLLSVLRIRKQKLYTALSILAVAISMFLYTICGFMLSSMDAMTLASAQRAGNFHTQISSWNTELYSNLKSDTRIEKIAVNAGIGLLQTESGVSIHFEEWDTAMFEMMGAKLVDGQMPMSTNEIILDENAAEFYGNPEVGSEIQIAIQCKSASGESIGELSDAFIVSGILANNVMMNEVSRQSVAIIGSGYIEQNFANYQDFGRFVSLRVFDVNSLSSIYADYGIDKSNISENQALIEASLSAYSDSNPLASFSIPILLIVSLAAILILSNIFSISHLSRLDELGLLRVIGMTNGQAYALNVMEAIVLSLIGIPLGFLLASLVSGAILPSILLALDPGGALVQTEFYRSANLVTISPASTIQAIVIACTVTILSSVWATFKSRKTDPVKLFVHVPFVRRRKKHVDTKRPPTLLSLVNMEITRDTKKTVLVIMSIALSVTLFLAFFNILSMVNVDDRVEAQIVGDFAVHSVPRNGEPIESWSKISPRIVDELTDRYSIKAYTLRIIYEMTNDSDNRTFVIDDERFDSLRKESGISESLQGVIAYTDFEQDHVVIDGVAYPVIGHTDTVFPGVDSIYFYYLPENEHVFGDIPMRRVDFKVDNGNHDEVYAALRNAFEDTSSYSIGTYEETKAQLMQELATLRAVIYVFIAIIALISLINIMNTLYSSSLMNVAEYAIERTIGATMGQLAAIHLLQAVFFAGIALIVSIPLSLILVAVAASSEISAGLYFVASVSVMITCAGASLPAIISLGRRPLIETILRG